MKEVFHLNVLVDVTRTEERWRYFSETDETCCSTNSNSPIDHDLIMRCESTEPIISSITSRNNKTLRYLSQFFACFSVMMILFGKGLAASYPTIVVGSLSQEHSTDYLRPHLDNFKNVSFFSYFPFNTQDQRSTYASIGHIFQPIGSLFGGIIIDIIGRKRVMILLTFPMFTGWLLLFFSRSDAYLYCSNALFGIGIGLSESPIATYIAEVTETQIRGTVLTLALLFKTIAYLVPFIVDMQVESWRWTALFLAAQPIFVAFLAIIVPESPSWLVSKGRIEDAGKSLSRLRGWVNQADVQEEVHDLIAYHNREKRMLRISDNPGDESTSKNTVKEEIIYMTSYRIRKPFLIIVVMFFVSYSVGMLTLKPYLEIIVNEMGVNMDMKKAAMFIIMCGGIGNLVGVFLIHRTGKRILSLSGLTGNAISSLILALTAYKTIPSDYALYTFFCMAFSTWLGIATLPWILQGELFPYRGRGKASGGAAALNNIIAFIIIKTFILLKDSIHLVGVFFVFFTCSVLAVIFVYFKLPETEGKSKEEIEAYFTPSSKKSGSKNSKLTESTACA